jgi:hypothetical protein
MGTNTRSPNKVIWGMDEAIEIDAALIELLNVLIDQVDTEKFAAESRFDTKGRLRLSEMLLTLVRMQQKISRLESLHRMARKNEYDRR